MELLVSTWLTTTSDPIAKMNANIAKETIRNFYGIYEEDGKLVSKEGWERIPENWYKAQTDYGLLHLNSDILEWALKYPELAR